MSEQERQGKGGQEQSAVRVGHLTNRSHEPGRLALTQAIAFLVPSGKRKEVLAVFHNRVSWSGYRHWRAGRRPVPEWAMLAVQERLQVTKRQCEALTELTAAPR